MLEKRAVGINARIKKAALRSRFDFCIKRFPLSGRPRTERPVFRTPVGKDLRELVEFQIAFRDVALVEREKAYACEFYGAGGSRIKLSSE